MESTLYIGGKAINVSAKLKALMLYKRQFGEEYLDRYVQIQKAEGDTGKLAEDVTITAFRIIWAMAKAYDNSIPPPEVVMILLPLKDRIPYSPNEPSFLPLYSPPSRE